MVIKTMTGKGKSMTRKLICGPLAAALSLSSVTPAVAQEYRFTGFDAPRGATATVNLRVPLGGAAERRRPSVGVALGYGQSDGEIDQYGRQQVRAMRVADFRIDRDGLSRAELATFNLANLDGDARLQFLNPDENKKNVFWLALIVAAGIAAIIFLDDGSSDSGESEELPPTDPPRTGG
ncbi:MAG: hypothetical protein ACXWU1_08905 [Allosphingosinicella sp.]